MSSRPKDVTIIGAGLAGLLLAIALHRHSISCHIYEARPAHEETDEAKSGVVLTPNGLAILSKLGVYDHIKPRCWTSAYRTFKNAQDETTRRVLVADASLYGYSNHRLYRTVLLSTLKTLCSSAGIPITYSARFDGITSESSTGVTFTIDDSPHQTDMLIGADGIYSSVRKYLHPDIRPEYTGTVGLLGHIRWDSVAWPHPDFEKQCTIQAGPGAFFMMPENKEGSDVMVGMQVRHPDVSRAEWDRMGKDPDVMVSFFRRNYDGWHETGKKVIDAVTAQKETLYLWPFLKMPKLDRWFSADGRVVILGDAAHAIPPSSGQGVNQALEDVWAFTELIAADDNGETGEKRRGLVEKLEFWQELRQKRVDAVWNWAANGTNVHRMPEEERKKILQERGIEEIAEFDDMSWLYVSKTDEAIKQWLES